MAAPGARAPRRRGSQRGRAAAGGAASAGALRFAPLQPLEGFHLEVPASALYPEAGDVRAAARRLGSLPAPPLPVVWSETRDGLPVLGDLMPSKRATSKAGKGKGASSAPALDTTIAPKLGPRGRGRPRKLSREQMDDVCRLLAMGMSVVKAARACGMVRSQYYLWKAQGEADAEAGRRTIEAEFSDRVDIYEAVGAAGLWGRVIAGTAVPTGDNVDLKRVRAKVDAGKLALAAYAVRFGGRVDGQPGRAGEEDEQRQREEAPKRKLDLSKLSREEVPEFRRMLRKMQGEG